MTSSMGGRRWSNQRQNGVTLIELMVTIAVMAVFVMLAVPSFVNVRERAIVRGAAGNLVAAVARARFEAAKRNDYVTVSVRGSGSAWCIGLQSGTTGCDCLSGTCNIDQVSTSSLNGARLLSAANFNASSGGSGSTDFSVDPRLIMLQNLAPGGSLVLRSPSDTWDYRVQFNLSSTAKTQLCSPAGAKNVLSDYPSC